MDDLDGAAGPLSDSDDETACVASARLRLSQPVSRNMTEKPAQQLWWCILWRGPLLRPLKSFPFRLALPRALAAGRRADPES